MSGIGNQGLDFMETIEHTTQCNQERIEQHNIYHLNIAKTINALPLPQHHSSPKTSSNQYHTLELPMHLLACQRKPLNGSGIKPFPITPSPSQIYTPKPDQTPKPRRKPKQIILRPKPNTATARIRVSFAEICVSLFKSVE